MSISDGNPLHDEGYNSKKEVFFMFWAQIESHQGDVQCRQPSDATNKTKKIGWMILLYGQAISLCATSMNASSFTLEYKYQTVVPNFLMWINYILLATYVWIRRRGHETTNAKDDASSNKKSFSFPLFQYDLSAPWWTYFLISILDVVANYMLLTSLKFTTLTSTTLLGALTVPSTMLTSRWILVKLFRGSHYLGVCLCLIGGMITVWLDHHEDTPTADPSEQSPRHPHAIIGDCLAILSAVLYGLGDTVGELFVKHVDQMEYLGMLGVFGALLTGLQFPILEWRALQILFMETSGDIQLQILGVVLWYLVSLFMYYVSATGFYVYGDATLLNLSLQTSNLWALLFSVAAMREAPSPAFYIAVVFVTVGVFVYELHGNEKKNATTSGLSGQEQSFLLDNTPNTSYCIF